MKRKLNIDPKEAAIRKRNISVYNDNLRIIINEGGNYHCDNGKFHTFLQCFQCREDLARPVIDN